MACCYRIGYKLGGSNTDLNAAVPQGTVRCSAVQYCMYGYAQKVLLVQYGKRGGYCNCTVQHSECNCNHMHALRLCSGTRPLPAGLVWLCSGLVTYGLLLAAGCWLLLDACRCSPRLHAAVLHRYCNCTVLYAISMYRDGLGNFQPSFACSVSGPMCVEYQLEKEVASNPLHYTARHILYCTLFAFTTPLFERNWQATLNLGFRSLL